MADHHTLAPRPVGYPAGYRDGRRDGLVTPEDLRGSSYDTGESSNMRGPRDTTLIHDQTLEFPDDDPLHLDDGHVYQEERTQRKHRNRASGAFLLQDTVAAGRNLGHRRQRATPQTLSQSHSSGSRDTKFLTSSSSDQGWRQSSMPIRRSIGEPPNGSMDGSTHEMRRFSDSHHASQQAPPLPDLDSTQIVNMALNLSESRRLAARRPSRVTPPRLVPLPDASSSGNLRQHFQQQRKFSRNVSPKPFQESTPRIPSGPRISSPFQPSFDAGHDAQYRWQFSASTLARAHKAKEHLELLAQYRRLLEVLPPLKPGLHRPSSSNPPGSPVMNPKSANFGGQVMTVKLGRQYNPLQYIRNRKVRARERKIIDGERQGFGDVECVRSWVDTVCDQMSLAGTSLVQDQAPIPPFPGAEELDNQASPEPAAKTAPRSRRPRVDWFMEPCDMIADAYWLEQDGHKQLIEDRQWRKIFPSIVLDLHRPISREVDDPSIKASPFPLKANEPTENITDTKDAGLVKVRTDLSHSSAKERAKQRLQNIKGFHHRHGSSVHGHHDFLRLKKDSASEFSDSDNDAINKPKKQTRPNRKGTISSNTNDLLQKQMLEMIAKDAQERELEAAVVHTDSADDPGVRTPERGLSSKPPSRFQSRRGSMADASDSDRKAALERARLVSPVRHSLDINYSMGSLGNYSSIPNSPELQARNGNIEAIASAELSPPWSRSASPSRNPLTKIKQIIRDKSGDSGDSHHEDAEDDGDRRLSKQFPVLVPSESTSALSRRQSSPAGKPTPESYKHHRSTGSIRLRSDDAVGLRGMFKGPQIDTVIRGGVSKLGDIIWKKDGPGEAPELETTDESDSDRIRGRRRTTPLSLSRRTSNRTQDGHQPKNFLDSMPQFHPIHDSAADGIQKSVDGSTNHIRQSSQFDFLKPPQIDVRSASPSLSPPVVHKTRPGDSDASESESFPGSNVPEGVRDTDRRLNSAIALVKFDQNGRPVGRHWSITDRDVHDRTMLSKREVARMRALILSSGIKAMEIRRRACEQHKPFSKQSLANDASSQKDLAGLPWADISKLGPEQPDLRDRQVVFHELYPLAAQTLGITIQAWGRRWQSSADHFSNRTSHDLRRRVWDVRTRLADDLSEITRKAADEADETSRDLALGQPLKIKHVVDTMENMLRRRRKGFRWLRRGLWLMVEWLLVGFMWYVWFVVMILRIFLGIGKGLWSGVKWLFWL